MKPEDKVVEEVVAYFSESQFSEFSIHKEVKIQMGTDNRRADIVLCDSNGNFVAIAECKSPGGTSYGIPQLQSYLSATDTPFGLFAPRVDSDSWVFYRNLRQNRFEQIERSDFESEILKKDTEIADSVIPTKILSKTEYSNVPIGTSNPGCIIILVDQSWSMSEPFGNGTKAERATQAVNSVIENIVLACRSGDTIRERCHISVIGYGGHVNCVLDGMISEIVSSIIYVKKVKKLIPDGAGGVIEIESEMPIWLEPQANSQTPMHKAFERAAEIIEHWISDRPDAFPPIVINITDGAATRPDLAADAARKIISMETTDGASLVFNLHIADGRKEIIFPYDTTQFSGEPLAEYLFDISSELPQPLFERAKSVGLPAVSESRCFGYNADETSMITILNFGTLGLTQIKALPPSIA